MSGGKSALIIGATGATGKHLLQELLQSSTFTRVGEYGRRVTPEESITVGKEKLEQKTIDFEKLEEAGLKDGKWDVVYITLGTKRALAGSAAAFERIDKDYVINAARLAKHDDTTQPQRVVYLSSMGSDPNSYFLYPRCKGQTELGLASLGYKETIIFRPGLLTERGDHRVVEALASSILNLSSSLSAKYSISTSLLSKAMRIAGEVGTEGLPEAAEVKKGGDSSSIFSFLDNGGIRGLLRESK